MLAGSAISLVYLIILFVKSLLVHNNKHVTFIIIMNSLPVNNCLRDAFRVFGLQVCVEAEVGCAADRDNL